MNEPSLDLFGGQMTVQTISDLSTTPLWPLLTSGAGDSRQELVKWALKNPDLKAMAQSCLPALDRLRQPSGDEDVYKAMQPLLIMYGRPKKHDAELTAWWSLYFEALKDFPVQALDKAVSDYIATSTIHTVPAAGVLAKLAQAESFKIKQAYARAKIIATAEPPPGRETPEERARMREIIARMRRPDGSLDVLNPEIRI